jgi:hypothetical protein
MPNMRSGADSERKIREGLPIRPMLKKIWEEGVVPILPMLFSKFRVGGRGGFSLLSLVPLDSRLAIYNPFLQKMRNLFLLSLIWI